MRDEESQQHASGLQKSAIETVDEHLLILCRPTVGFFATFLQVLGELDLCEEQGLTPLVFLGSNWPYWSEGGYNGAINGWEYYFEPVSDGKLEELVGRDEEYFQFCNIFDFPSAQIRPNQNPRHLYDLSRSEHLHAAPNVTVVNRWPKDRDFGVRRVREDRRHRAAQLIEKYVRLRQPIRDEVEAFHQRHLDGHYVIGVHARGETRNIENENWHRLAHAGCGLFFREVDRALSRNRAARIFLATDSPAILERYRKRYGDKVVTFESTRSAEGLSVFWEVGGAEIGREVLIDALLLARSDFLIHGISNVAFAALCFAPELEHIDIYEKHETRLRYWLKAKEARRRLLRKYSRALDRIMAEKEASRDRRGRRSKTLLTSAAGRFLGHRLTKAVTRLRPPRAPLVRPDLAFVFVCQRGELELKSLLLAASLRQQSRTRAELIAAVPNVLGQNGAPSESTLRALDDLGARVVTIQNRVIGHHKREGDLLINKAYCLGIETQAQRLAFVDSDILCLRPWDETALLKPQYLSAKPVDLQTERRWTELYDVFGMRVPETQILSTRSAEPGPPYFNSGFIVVEPFVGRQLRDLWLDTFTKITASGAMDDNPFFREQVSLAVAVQRAKLDFGLLEEEYNYPAHLTPVREDRLPVFAHYHRPDVIADNDVLRESLRSLSRSHPPIYNLALAHADWAALLA